MGGICSKEDEYVWVPLDEEVYSLERGTHERIKQKEELNCKKAYDSKRECTGIVPKDLLKEYAFRCVDLYKVHETVKAPYANPEVMKSFLETGRFWMIHHIHHSNCERDEMTEELCRICMLHYQRAELNMYRSLYNPNVTSTLQMNEIERLKTLLYPKPPSKRPSPPDSELENLLLLDSCPPKPQSKLISSLDNSGSDSDHGGGFSPALQIKDARDVGVAPKQPLSG